METITDIESYILQHFQYHEDGTITRDDRKNSTGSLDKDGYLILKVKKRQFKAHRIAWFLNYGKFPECEIDHINRNKLDNRIENLRESNRTQQNRNKDIPVNVDTGVRGVYVDKATKGLKKKYTFRYKGKTHRFYTVGEAVKAKALLREKEI